MSVQKIDQVPENSWVEKQLEALKNNTQWELKTTEFGMNLDGKQAFVCSELTKVTCKKNPKAAELFTQIDINNKNV